MYQRLLRQTIEAVDVEQAERISRIDFPLTGCEPLVNVCKLLQVTAGLLIPLYHVFSRLPHARLQRRPGENSRTFWNRLCIAQYSRNGQMDFGLYVTFVVHSILSDFRTILVNNAT